MDLSPCQNLCRPGRRHSTIKRVYSPNAATHIIVNGADSNGILKAQNVIVPVQSTPGHVATSPETLQPSGYLLYPTDGYRVPLSPYPDPSAQKVVATVDSEVSVPTILQNATHSPKAITKYRELEVPTPGTQQHMSSLGPARAGTAPVGNACSTLRRDVAVIPSHLIRNFSDSQRKAEVLETILNARESELEEQASEIRALRMQNKRLATKVGTASEHQ